MLAVSLVDVPSHMTAIAAWMLEYPVAYVVDNMVSASDPYNFVVLTCVGYGSVHA